MKTERECEEAAHVALQEYVNTCNCADRKDAALAIQKMLAVAMHALGAVQNWRMEKVQ